MKVYLAKPGGEKQGPFTVEQINQNLAAGTFRENEYWAWHEGLAEWKPLHLIAGVASKAKAPAPALKASTDVTATSAVAESKAVSLDFRPAVATRPDYTPAPEPIVARTPGPTMARKPELVAAMAPAAVANPAGIANNAASVGALPGAEPGGTEIFSRAVATTVAEKRRGSNSGLPFFALDHVFVFTTGEGRTIYESALVAKKVQDTCGENFASIRGTVPVDVIGRVDVRPEDSLMEGEIPPKAQRAICAIKPPIGQNFKDGLYKACFRVLLSETNDVVAFVLFYNRRRLI